MHKISKIIINKKAERGSPCLTPLSTTKGWVEKPLLRTQLEMLSQNVWIHCINNGPKPNADNVRNKKIPAYSVKRFFFYTDHFPVNVISF